MLRWRLEAGFPPKIPCVRTRESATTATKKEPSHSTPGPPDKTPTAVCVASGAAAGRARNPSSRMVEGGGQGNAWADRAFSRRPQGGGGAAGGAGRGGREAGLAGGGLGAGRPGNVALAAIIPGDSAAEAVLTSGVFSFLCVPLPADRDPRPPLPRRPAPSPAVVRADRVDRPWSARTRRRTGSPRRVRSSPPPAFGPSVGGLGPVRPPPQARARSVG